MFGLGPMELLIVGIVAVLLFGKRLPEVARSAGKSLVEFKKGMRGIEDEVHSASDATSGMDGKTYLDDAPDTDDYQDAVAPKFVPPSAEPQVEEPAVVKHDT